MNIGILASHNGTNLQSIIDATNDGLLNAKVSVVISNNSTSGAAERAKKHQIIFSHLSSVTHPDPSSLDLAILKTLEENDVNIVFLAGYMKKLGQHTLRKFKGRILNTHPALLPKHGGKGMYGMNVHKAVIEHGESESGVSIHLVDENYDTGRIIAQTKVPVITSDTPETLCSRVMAKEREFVVEVLSQIAEGRLSLES